MIKVESTKWKAVLEKINKIKNWFSEKISEIDKPLKHDRLRKKRERSKKQLIKTAQQEIANWNNSTYIKVVEPLIKDIPTNKTSGLAGFADEFFKTFKEEIIQS